MSQSNPDAGHANLKYRGYQQPQHGGSDELLVRVSKGSAYGEYLRRYWQPVALTLEIKDMPRLIKVMGEELVIFFENMRLYQAGEPLMNIVRPELGY